MPRRNSAFSLGLMLCLCATSIQAASFDCDKASTPVERLICSDSGLGSLDERMADAYRQLRATTGDDPEAREGLVGAQRQWLKRRNACKNATCLGQLYQTRIRVLSESMANDMEQIEIRESGPHYGIEARFPMLKGSSSLVRSVNREIRAFIVGGILDPFRNDVTEGLAEELEDASKPDSSWEVRDWSLGIEAGLPHRTRHFLAIPFTGYDYRGGAHGMPLLDVLIVDLASGERIPNERLFVQGSGWLGVLSERCYRELKRQFAGIGMSELDEDWLRRGTEPGRENYGVLFPAQEGLKVIFLPYQVAPYAVGSLEVLIPYAEIEGILNPELFAS